MKLNLLVADTDGNVLDVISSIETDDLHVQTERDALVCAIYVSIDIYRRSKEAELRIMETLSKLSVKSKERLLDILAEDE